MGPPRVWTGSSEHKSCQMSQETGLSLDKWRPVLRAQAALPPPRPVSLRPSVPACLLCFPPSLHNASSLQIRFFFLNFIIIFWGPHLRHMEVPRLGVES